MFSSSIEGFLRTVKPVLDSSLTAELQAIGLDPTKPVLPAYPVEVLRHALVLGARRLSPQLPADQQLTAMGRRYVEGFGDTMVGKALKTGIRLLGPGRTLARLAKQFRTANNYSETKTTTLAPGRVELWCNDVTHPSWYLGLIAGTMEVAGGRDVKVTLTRHDAEGAFFLVEWQS